jgi:hypothetical protein
MKSPSPHWLPITLLNIWLLTQLLFYIVQHYGPLSSCQDGVGAYSMG